MQTAATSNNLFASGASQLFQKFNEFKSDKTKVKQALGATGALVVVAGTVFGLQSLLKQRPKPTLKHLSPAMSHYLQYNEDWYNQMAAMSDYGHFAPSSFERLAEGVCYLIYATADLESVTPNFSKLYLVSQIIGIIVESIRVLRAHVHAKYGQVPQVMLEFDEIAGNMQQLCNDTQFNVDNIVAYNNLTKK